MKKIVRLFMLFIGSLLYRNNRSKILFYHDVVKDKSYKSLDSDVLMGTSLDVFKQHIEMIRREGYDIVPQITCPNNQVAIMFDDGFRGIWDNRYYFYELDIKPTIFLAVELIEKEGFLTKSEILELQKNGFRFACHSWTHTNLADKTDEELVKELVLSKSYLSKLLGNNIHELCLPIGYFSRHLIEKCFECGYEKIYSSIPGCYYDKILFNLYPRNLCQFATPMEVKMILRGGGMIMKKRYERMHYIRNK